MLVTFCGHKEVSDPDRVRAWLALCLERLIQEGAAEFYLGGYGEFDRLAASMVWSLKEKYAAVRSVLVLPYLDRLPDGEYYDLTTYPPLENVPRRYAILRRNEWMVQAADVVVAYVLHDWGGAARTLDYARRKKKRIVLYGEC